jgi:thiamine biosynthesis lipoprotein
MGTRLAIAIAVDPERDADPLLREAFSTAQALEALLSHYRADSALGRLNARAAAARESLEVEVDPGLFRFLERCQRYSEATRGAFDVTAGRLVALYAGAAKPDAASLADARRATGYRRLQLVDSHRVRLPSGVRLDPAAIGKGYAIDAVVSLLRRRGVARAFIDFGGSSFYGIGAPGWPVLLHSVNPDEHLGVVVLHDEGLSSSLSRPFTPHGGPAAPHIVDPRTGSLVTERRFAAVVSRSATAAEVLSTALVVDPALASRIPTDFAGAVALTQREGAEAVIDPRLRARIRPLGAKRAP